LRLVSVGFCVYLAGVRIVFLWLGACSWTIVLAVRCGCSRVSPCDRGGLACGDVRMTTAAFRPRSWYKVRCCLPLLGGRLLPGVPACGCGFCSCLAAL